VPTVSLKPLEERPELSAVLASWAYFEWSIPMGRSWEKTLERYDPATGAALPTTYVAMVDDAPAGMASLRERDSHDFVPGTTPWICNVYVHAAMRRLGLAGSLCQKLADVAAELGFKEVFLASSLKADSLYHRLGFREVAEVSYFGPKYVLRLPLAGRPHSQAGSSR
jgi:GNAT superfamily N-acetyltransferase